MATRVLVTLADGRQVAVNIYPDGLVEADVRAEQGELWRPVEMVGGSVVVDRQAA